MLDRLDDDDGIVHNQADCQHQAEEREGVDREAEQRKDHEGADQRDWYGHERDQRRAPTLQEEVHH